MSGPIQPNEVFDSVDLTEDEQSSEENFSNNPLNFVDCNSTEETISSTFGSPSLSSLTRANKIVPLGSSKQSVKYKHVPNLIKRRELASIPAILSQRKIKPRPSILAETQDIVDVDSSKTSETACVDSGEVILGGVPTSQNVPVGYQVAPNNTQNYTIYSQKQPGKVVIIKKNNKYYKIVIPHNVMPNVNQSTGPVLINIPEVGPLVIRNDPQVTTSTIPVNQPFSLNLDDVLQGQPKNSAQPVKKPKKIPEMNPKEAALCNKKFCWTLCKGKKRDLEGFCYTDRLGFTRAEFQRARKCSTILNSIVNKKKTELINQMHQFNMFKESVKKNKAKTGKTRKGSNKIKFDVDESELPSPLPKIPEAMSMALENISYNPQNTHILTNKDTDYDCDLLLTKKVVILNNRDSEPVAKKKKFKRKRITKQKRRTTNKMKLKRIWAKKLAQHKQAVANSNKSFMLKPCYVHMVHDEIVEEAYRKFMRRLGFNCKQNPNENSGYQTEVRRGRPKTKSNTVNIKTTITSKTTGLQKGTNTETICKDVSKNPLFLNIINTLKARIISSEESFKKEINYLKPILIISDYNLGIVNYTTQFAKSNIIYLVKENANFPLSILRNNSFISAFELGYLKLVDSQLFCKYIMGSEAFNQPGAEHVSDHNYCLSKNKLM